MAIVQFALLKSSAATTGETLATLPAELRPSTFYAGECVAYSAAAAIGSAAIQIVQSGAMTLLYVPTNTVRWVRGTVVYPLD